MFSFDKTFCDAWWVARIEICVFVYWKVSVALKCVRTSRIESLLNLAPKYTNFRVQSIIPGIKRGKAKVSFEKSNGQILEIKMTKIETKKIFPFNHRNINKIKEKQEKNQK